MPRKEMNTDKFKITDIPLVEFSDRHYKDGYIEIPLSECGALRYQMAKYRLENGLHDTPAINVKSPTGNIKTFAEPSSIGSGVQYRCGDLRLRILHNVYRLVI